MAGNFEAGLDYGHDRLSVVRRTPRSGTNEVVSHVKCSTDS